MGLMGLYQIFDRQLACIVACGFQEAAGIELDEFVRSVGVLKRHLRTMMEEGAIHESFFIVVPLNMVDIRRQVAALKGGYTYLTNEQIRDRNWLKSPSHPYLVVDALSGEQDSIEFPDDATAEQKIQMLERAGRKVLTAAELIAVAIQDISVFVNTDKIAGGSMSCGDEAPVLWGAGTGPMLSSGWLGIKGKGYTLPTAGKRLM